MRPVYSHVRQTPTQGTHSAPLGAFFAPTCAMPAKLAVLPACNRARSRGLVRQGGTPRGAAPWQSLSGLRAAWPALLVLGCWVLSCPQCVASRCNHRCGSISRRAMGGAVGSHFWPTACQCCAIKFAAAPPMVPLLFSRHCVHCGPNTDGPLPLCILNCLRAAWVHISDMAFTQTPINKG